jgi:hypothetical protein
MPVDKYTLWNQAVEAVEIYLARYPRELTEDQLQALFKDVNNTFTRLSSAEVKIKPDSPISIGLVGLSVNRL